MNLLLVAALPLFFAAPLQVVFQLSPDYALAAATLLCIGAGYLSRRFFTIAKSPQGWDRYLWCAVAVAAAAAAVRLWSPLWGALVSTGGGDVGDHVFYISRMQRDAAAQYNGLIVFHTFAWWWIRLTGASFYATFAALFWCAVAVAVISVISRSVNFAAAQLSPVTRRSGAIGVLLVLVVAVIPFEGVLLPVLHLLQGEGYYPQLWGLLPLLAAWIGYSAVENPLGRAIVLLLSIVVYRYTYTLNLGELVATAAVLAGVEFSHLLPRHEARRWAILGCLGLGTLASYRIFSTLLVLLQNGGATKSTNVWCVIAATALMGAFLAAEAGREPTGSARARSAAFAALFSLIAAIMQTIYLLSGLPEFYYFYKFGIHPLWIATAAAVVHLPAALLKVQRMRYGRVRRAVLLSVGSIALCIGGVAFACVGVSNFRPSYLERSSSLLPPEHLVVFNEPEAAAIISKVLQERSLRFGGYITRPAWALSGFMNAAFGMSHRFRDPYYRSGAVRSKKGNCVFWDSTPGNLERLDLVSRGQSGSPGSGGRRVRALANSPDISSAEFHSLPTGETRVLSYRCFP